jgi:Domain of unknown function (DUF4168)
MTRPDSADKSSYGGMLLAAGLVLATTIAPAVGAPDAPGQREPDQALTQMPAANPPISDATIGKAGAALRDVANVQRDYTGKLNAANSNEEKRGLTEQANAQAVQAIQSHGLSLQEYSSVVQTARSDPQLMQRLLSAANITQ